MVDKKQLRASSPPISGIYDIKVEATIFKMLCIQSDDTSVVDRVLNKAHYDSALSQWQSWCQNKGVYIDIGAHTGLYTLVAMGSNQDNKVITFEPLPINYFRILSNLRLNDLKYSKKVNVYNLAVSDKNKEVNFTIPSDHSYLSKGGKIDKQVQGLRTKAIHLDSLNIADNIKINGIKIDTEGEDLNVLKGGLNLISRFMPKLMIETRKDNYNDIINLIKTIGYKDIYTFNDNIKDKDLSLDFNKYNIKDIFAE